MDDRPNILLIMTDQQRGDCLSIEGHPVLETPNMDHIAAAGARFTRAYATCPVCIPARRSLMTGQHPATHGLVGYRDHVHWDPPPTLPAVLRDAGYHTAIVGRSMHTFPVRRRFGFQEMSIHDHKDHPSDYDLFLRTHAPEYGDWMGGGVMHNDWTARPWHLPEPLHMTNWTVDRALRFLRRRDPSCPWFLCVSFIAPHPPLQPPAFYFDRYLRQRLPEPVIGDWASPPDHDGLGDDVANRFVHLTGERLRAARAGYFGLINHVDDQLRRLLNPVRGIDRRNTVVLFTSDHGEMLGDHHLWRKSEPFEPAARIPLLVAAPPRFDIAPRTTLDAPVCLEDIMPTALDFAGLDIPDSVEGRSLLPLMRGESPPWRDHLHLEHAGLHQSLTDGREKYIWRPADGSELFFNLTADPNETRNLAADPAHADRLAAWRRRLVDQLRDRPEGFVENDRLVPGRPYPALMPHGGTPD